MAALDDVESRVNQCADTILKASNMAYDTVRHFGNMQQVVSTGQAGALALADTLAAAPVGDAAQVRANIGAQQAGNYMSGDANLMNIGLGGDPWQVRQRIGLGNDDAGRLALGLGAAATRSVADGETFNGPLMPVGYQGIGSSSLSVTGSMLGVKATGFYSYGTSTSDSGKAGGYGNMLHLQSNMIDWRSNVAFATNGRIYYSCFTNNSWNALFGELMIKGVSCTVDGNGYLKPSSPIFRVGMPDAAVSDGLLAAGYGAANGEASGVTCERVSEGVYKITGSLGFADDNVWTIETPRDENSQPLMWVNTTQSDDGTITVETYHREHPSAPVFARNKVEGKSDGDPIDIPAGRWIDLRLKMPEKEEGAE